jgi:type IV secretory pathway TrbF-like protein
MEEDLSKKTLVALVLLSCIISLVGTIAMIYEFSTSQAAPLIIENEGKSNAEAGFTIGTAQEPQQSQQSGATGFATFAIGE